MSEDGIDQCGPGWTSRYLWQGRDGVWVPACQEHDRRYTDRTGKRSEADRALLRGLWATSPNDLHRAVALAYYAAVRLGGWALWYSGLHRR